MNALIVGLGSIGRRHSANLRVLSPSTRITVWRQRGRGAGSALPVQIDAEVHSLDEALATSPDFAIVSNPATLHVTTARDLAGAGVHLFVEKPISHSLEGVSELIAQCRAHAVNLFVAYNLRFDRSVQLMQCALQESRIGRLLAIRAEVGQYLPDWRPLADYRIGTTARSDLGGGVLLELSHELDLVRMLAGEVREVAARIGRLSDLEIDVEDCAEVLLGFQSGAIGSVHMDMIQRVPTRTCRLVGSHGTMLWDGITGVLDLFSASQGSWERLSTGGTDRNEMYLQEMKHFLACVRGESTPIVSGEDGRAVLNLALAARRAAVEARTVLL